MTYGSMGRIKHKLARRIDLAMLAVAVTWDVEAQELKAPTRGEQHIAFARQIAMYVAHVGLGLSLSQVGRAFGRDRTTARHACRVIEDRRDEPAFDARLKGVEEAISYFRLETERPQ